MKNNMKTNILGLCILLIAIVASGSVARANVNKAASAIYTTGADTSKNAGYKYQVYVRKAAVNNSAKASDREDLLKQLSKKPAEFTEVFSNAKEEYLWHEKVKAEQDEYERHVKELNQTTTAQH